MLGEEPTRAYAVREARPEDYDQICSLYSELDLFHHQAEPHAFAPPADPARPREFIERLIQDDACAIFVAERRGLIVGLVALMERSTPNVPVFVPERYLVVEDLVVTERLRRGE